MQVEVTDGWYGVRASLDAPLADLLQRGRLRVGAPPCASPTLFPTVRVAQTAPRVFLLRLWWPSMLFLWRAKLC